MLFFNSLKKEGDHVAMVPFCEKGLTKIRGLSVLSHFPSTPRCHTDQAYSEKNHRRRLRDYPRVQVETYRSCSCEYNCGLGKERVGPCLEKIRASCGREGSRAKRDT